MSRPTLIEMETAYEAMILRARDNWPPSSETIRQLRVQELLIDSERQEQGLSLRFHTAEQLRIILGTDDDGHDGHTSALERHYLPSSAAETLRFRFANPSEMSMDPDSDELNVVPCLLRAASGDQVATGLTSGLGPAPAAESPWATRRPAMPQPPKVALLPPYEVEEESDEEQEETVTVGRRTTITLGAFIKQLQELEKTLGYNAPVWHVEMGGITATRGAEEWEDGVAIE